MSDASGYRGCMAIVPMIAGGAGAAIAREVICVFFECERPPLRLIWCPPYARGVIVRLDYVVGRRSDVIRLC
jgi:hypothetical protein